MLVLSRKVNERITIGDNIYIIVLAINGRQVRLGIEAPPGVAIFRDELLGGPTFGSAVGHELTRASASSAMSRSATDVAQDSR